MSKNPIEKIKYDLSKKLSPELLNIIPNKWEKIGDVLIIKLHPNIEDFSNIVGEVYAKNLDCKAVLQDISGISGTYREPNVRIIYGFEDTETIHKENGIEYKLDPQKIMFSSGNMDERIRMAKISNKNEIVVDLFAGIGYFSLPVAVYSKPKTIFACEINPVAYNYLCKNILLNHVTSIVKPILGDNKKNAPKNVADRIIMGYFENTDGFLQVAFDCLKNNKGIIHYHDLCPNKSLPKKSLNFIEEKAKEYNQKIKLLTYKNIKSYAPGISHIVLDVKIGD